MTDSLTSLDLASLPVSQPTTDEAPAVATHLSYKQAEDILGPYLDIYLFTGRLSRGAGVCKDKKTGKAVPTQGVISIESVRTMADHLHASDHPDPRAEQEHDWPKETEHYQRPHKAKAKGSAAPPAELIAALAYPGMNLELFHWHGAPGPVRLAEILDGAEARPDELHRMGEALSRLRASGRSSF